MNSDAVCHEIDGVPGLFVDAFRGHYLRMTEDSQNTFLLSHYHGDHYGSLPRDGKYRGPALIHCTPVTAALLRNVHKVPSHFVVEHDYGTSWTLPACATTKNGNHRDQVKITFYDANHCPGAAIIVIQLPGNKFHLHTGDMRYHPKMKLYPVLQQAVKQRALDLLYLDTTYGHPKHDFVAQDVAVNSIAEQVHDLFSAHGQVGRSGPADHAGRPNSKVLVLLSCYSIGKEKVLWEASNRANQLVYVSERKLEMMSCIQSQSTNYEANGDDHALTSSRMIDRCTRDPNSTDLQVIPMGLAGEIWPYFRPNYRNCLDYEEDLERNYNKIVAFIPTGWANASNYNKKNSISKRQLQCRKSQRFVDIEIRLISYSEHSACSELMEFVKFCRPRKVIPTVFSDANDRRRLENLFRKHVDTSRAKLQFFKEMQQSKSASAQQPSSLETSLKADTNGDHLENERAPSIHKYAAGETFNVPEMASSKFDNYQGTSNETSIDLTDSGDEADNCGGSTHLHQQVTATTSVTVDNRSSRQLTDRSPNKSPAGKTRKNHTTPVKRKQSKAVGHKSTPPITSFFAVKRGRREL